MKKLFCWILALPLSVLACTPKDSAYFKIHPKALQEAITQCPSVSPKLVSCDELHHIALRINEFVYALRMSPQAYGQSILSLQETIAKQSDKPDLKAKYDENKQELRERLAVVGWLESPGGV